MEGHQFNQCTTMLFFVIAAFYSRSNFEKEFVLVMALVQVLFGLDQTHAE